jgi:hypothetical protein
MQQATLPRTENGAGFELTRVRQFTVFLENRVGRLQALLHALEPAAGGVVAILVENHADSALARFVFSNAEAARVILRDAHFPFSEQDVLVVELPKRSKHPLLSVCSSLVAAEINIAYCYPLLVRPAGPAVVLSVDDPTLACQIFFHKGLRVLGETDLKK